MADRIFTSKQTEEIIRRLKISLKLEYGALARLALAYSLKHCGSDVPHVQDFEGKEIRDRTIFVDDFALFHCLINLIYKKYIPNDDGLFSKNSICKDHIDNGLVMLDKLFTECNKDSFVFFRNLADEFKEFAESGISIKALDLLVGKKRDLSHVIVELNNQTKHANSHLAIMGKPGVGKTQLLLKILADVRNTSIFQTNFIFFDYKGDVTSNNSFAQITKAITYDVSQEPIPVNPFVLNEYSENAIQYSAREKTESFSCIDNRFGPVQKGLLTDIIKAAYERRNSSELPYPDFAEILDIAKSVYSSQNKNDDTLMQTLKDLAEFSLFWQHGNKTGLIEKLTERTLIIDLHKLPVLKELVTYLVLERLYKEMAVLPDSRISNGRRFLRSIIVIDEAHNYLPQKNPFLQKIVREGRSKGVAVFFASQSPNDYDQKAFDFKELLEFAFIFGCEGIQTNTIQNLLGCTQKTSKMLQPEISRLQPFEVISKPLGSDEEYTKFSAIPFYQEYR